MKKIILIADDEKNIRMTLKQCLDSEEYELVLASNGEEVLELLQDKTFDLILLDIRMPGFSGIEVLRRIRKMECLSAVVIMTAYGTVENAVEAMKLGAVDFISKPFTPKEIRDMVRTVLARQKLDVDTFSTYNKTIEYAKKCIQQNKLGRAEEYLLRAINMDVNAPEPHNLYGVIAEYRRNFSTAAKHYRAAYALDPTYKAASENLERLAIYEGKKREINLDTREEEEERLRKNEEKI